VAVLAIAIAITAVVFRRPGPKATRPLPIAVLPLQNTNTAKDPRFLRIGLADDIATTLSYFPALSIRPFATKQSVCRIGCQFAEGRPGNARGAHHHGHFAVVGDNVEVTLEAIDRREQPSGLARHPARFGSESGGNTPANRCRVQHGLIATLGANASSDLSRTHHIMQKSVRAVSAAVSEGDPTNSRSSFSLVTSTRIQLLQRAVALDPGYSSAWAALGHRYYYNSGFVEGDEAAILNAKAALHRAVALDPGRIGRCERPDQYRKRRRRPEPGYDDITRLLTSVR